MTHPTLEIIQAYLNAPDFADRVVDNISRQDYNENRLVIYNYETDVEETAVDEALDLFLPARAGLAQVIVVDEERIAATLDKTELSVNELKWLPAVILGKLLAAEGVGAEYIDSLSLTDHEIQCFERAVENEEYDISDYMLKQIMQGDACVADLLQTPLTKALDDIVSATVVILPAKDREDYRPWSNIFSTLRAACEHSTSTDNMLLIKSPQSKIGVGDQQWGDGHFECHFHWFYENKRMHDQEISAQLLPVDPANVRDTVVLFKEALSPQIPAHVRVIGQPSGYGKSSVTRALQSSVSQIAFMESMASAVTLFQQDSNTQNAVIFVDEAHIMQPAEIDAMLAFVAEHEDARVVLLCHDVNAMPESIQTLKSDVALSGLPEQASFHTHR